MDIGGAVATAEIAVLSEAPVADAESLTGWLRGESELVGRVRRTGPSPRPGELGAVLDTVTVALSTGGTVTALIACLRTWLAHPRRSDIRLKVRREGGPAVEIDAKRVKRADVEKMLRAALEEDREQRQDPGTGE
ncbi:hypothetical protein MHW47_22370 [Streptomyces sp. OfavH-34-F]|uniref:effector-associated constant component EACC1 n=1 Tax=unclassified Streptomyces TaxID=2593676 RepID=UPI001EF17CB4|nr:hypothetical protein [Streptomyces sp. OfavH-34-F]MCG7527179.1 hypothetical protein [Streptomyces sp. OfavH-34-F]